MRKKANLKMIRNLVFFILLVIFTFWFIFKDQDINKLIDIVKSADTKYVIIGTVLMFMFYFMEAFNVKSILKLFNEKVSLLKSLKFTFIGFFFSSITPAATGGQPIEIYYMTKENIKGANATMALLMQLCGYQLSTILIGVLCAIINPNILKGGLIWLFLLGLTINGFVLIIMFICIFSQKLTQKLINIIIKILKLFKIKKIDVIKSKIEDGLAKYTESSIFIKSHMNEFIKSVIRVFIQVLFYYSVPFCVYKALGLNTYNYFEIFTMQAVLYTTVSSLPLPGSIGVSETVFLQIFGVAFGKKLLGGAMLLSRGITFYFYVILSMIVVIINAIIMKNIKGEIDTKVSEFEALSLEV